MENRYFDRPKQVMFYEAENDEWIVGIAYKDEIICACCGGIFDIDEVYELATEAGIKQAVYPYENWCSISEEIWGGEPPAGLEEREDGEGFIEIGGSNNE